MGNTVPPPVPTFREALAFWLRLGLIGFGGPAGQISIMHQELVENRRWISERRFLHALNYCMVLPGPEAQQLATYIGWLMHRTWGGIVAGALFVLPSLLILIALSWVYIAFGDMPLVAGLFYGIKPAVTAIVPAQGLSEDEVLRVDSNRKGELRPDEWKVLRERLFDVDRHANPRVIISVLMLREGFDVNNICVIVPLRASSASRQLAYRLAPLRLLP